MTLPYITLWKNDLNSEYPKVQQASIHRDYLKDTYNSHAYHCQPMTNANVSGWEFILPQDVVVVWDGINDSSSNHIKIIDGQYFNNKEIVRTTTGNGMLTFNLGVSIETDKDHYCILKGSPNYFLDDASPIEVIMRSDYYNFIENFICWKITTPNKPITFKKGMPIAFLVNYPIHLLESTLIEFKDISKNIEKNNQINKYNSLKENFYKKSKDWEWSHFYKKGTMSDENSIEVNLKPNLMEP